MEKRYFCVSPAKGEGNTDKNSLFGTLPAKGPLLTVGGRDGKISLRWFTLGTVKGGTPQVRQTRFPAIYSPGNLSNEVYGFWGVGGFAAMLIADPAACLFGWWRERKQRKGRTLHGPVSNFQ